MTIKLINIEGPMGDEKDWVFYFTIHDSNNNIVKSYENGISFFDIWKTLYDNFQKEIAFKLVHSAMSFGNI